MRIFEVFTIEVTPEKLTEYLLNTSHPDGMSKAFFFNQLGYSINNWLDFSDNLMQMCYLYDISKIEQTIFGTKYIVEGWIKSPDNRNPLIRTVWFVSNNENTAKLVTAYPL